MNYEEDTKNITAFKLMEANDKVVTMADGKQYLEKEIRKKKVKPIKEEKNDL